MKVFPMNTLTAELPVNSNLQPMESLSWWKVFMVFYFGSNNYIWNLYYETKNDQNIEYMCRVAGRVVEKGVVTEMRKF